jgi:hypothetical protein
MLRKTGSHFSASRFEDIAAFILRPLPILRKRRNV